MVPPVQLQWAPVGLRGLGCRDTALAHKQVNQGQLKSILRWSGASTHRAHKMRGSARGRMNPYDMRAPCTAIITRALHPKFTPNDLVLATASKDGDTRLWSTESGALLACLVGHTGPVVSLCIPRYGVLVSSSADGTVRSWSLHTGHAQALVDGCAEAGFRWCVRRMPGSFGVHVVATSSLGKASIHSTLPRKHGAQPPRHDLPLPEELQHCANGGGGALKRIVCGFRSETAGCGTWVAVATRAASLHMWYARP